MSGIMKIVKPFEESSLLTKDVSKTIKNEAKEQKGRFLSMLLGTLGASLLGNLLTGKDTIRAGEGTITAGQDFLCDLILQQILKYKSIIKMMRLAQLTLKALELNIFSKETNIYKIQAYNSIMCGYFFIGFIDFVLKGKSLIDYTNLFSRNEYEKNDKGILKYFH